VSLGVTYLEKEISIKALKSLQFSILQVVACTILQVAQMLSFACKSQYLE
jgi:hypothetical protein